jgi:peptidyl-tRNA hydrolase
MNRIKILVRKNLKMSEGKIAAQSIHAVLGLAQKEELNPQQSVVVLSVSDNKFKEAVAANEGKINYYIHKDLGYTEVEPNTETCMAFLEVDPRNPY